MLVERPKGSSLSSGGRDKSAVKGLDAFLRITTVSSPGVSKITAGTVFNEGWTCKIKYNILFPLYNVYNNLIYNLFVITCSAVCAKLYISWEPGALGGKTFLCSEQLFHWFCLGSWWAVRSSTLVALLELELEWTPLEDSLFWAPGGEPPEPDCEPELTEPERGVSSSWGIPESALLKHLGVAPAV